MTSRLANARRLYPEDRVALRELGLRDGLQLTKTFPSTPAKIEWIEKAHGAGVRHFEVGSFLPVRTFPQFADIRTLIRTVDGLDGAFSSALTLNEHAIADSLETPVDEIVVALSATEEHCMSNIRRSRRSAIGLLSHAVGERKGSDRPLINASISVSFGCSVGGEVAPEEVLRLAEACAEAGAEVIGIADTVGFAGPRQVRELCELVLPRVHPLPVIIHLHDTRGTGIANAYAALQAGVRVLDGTLGGLGGCPFAPGATGNVAFEDLVYLCERSGFATGIDLEKLLELRPILDRELPGETLYGALARAGPPATIRWQSGST
ncbi:MAG: hydroxymethylglutaryl-CoA lyase [Rhodobacteraceae bacterium]|nr:hydroxymethylglutaryl-CoA lyase [Paracoccaceae bacterium]